jgi:hypothetical protein
MGWTRRAPPQPAASGGVLSSPGLFGVPRSAKYAGLPPVDHPARGHSPDEIRRLAARAASPRCRSSSGISLCGQNSAGFRESARPFKGIICDDISEFESSLSGRVGVKHFQTARSILVFDATRRVLASLRDRHFGPPMMGLGGCGGPISRYVLAVRATAGIRLETDSPHPSSLRGHRSTDRRNSGFLLVFYCVQLAVRYMSVTSVH